MNEGGDFDKLGRGHVWHGEIAPCIHQNHVFSVRPHSVSPEWLNTVSGSAYAQFFFMGRAKQSTNLASISASNLSELPVVLPPEEELDQMLAFLDHETTKIDTLIAEQQTLIERLGEKGQSYIHTAVTKGLNRDCPFKESGKEWIGLAWFPLTGAFERSSSWRSSNPVTPRADSILNGGSPKNARYRGFP